MSLSEVLKTSSDFWSMMAGYQQKTVDDMESDFLYWSSCKDDLEFGDIFKYAAILKPELDLHRSILARYRLKEQSFLLEHNLIHAIEVKHEA